MSEARIGHANPPTCARFAKSDDGVSSQRDMRANLQNTTSSVGVAPLTIGGAMSEATPLPTPSPRHAPASRRVTTASVHQRDVREKVQNTA
jgi:hypothetical protein